MIFKKWVGLVPLVSNGSHANAVMSPTGFWGASVKLSVLFAMPFWQGLIPSDTSLICNEQRKVKLGRS